MLPSHAVFACLLALLLTARPAIADDSAPPAQPDSAPTHRAREDYLFPAAGRTSLALATGIPFLAMSELAAGIGDRVALGALAGIAMSGDGPPTNVGFGLRPRFDVWHLGKDNRVEIVAPTLYYPIVKGTWYLTRPSIQFEHAVSDRVRAYAALGAVFVMTQDALEGKTPAGTPVLPYGGTPGVKAGDAGTNGVWNTAGLGGAVRVGERTWIFGEGELVLRGLALPGDEWVGGVPFTVMLGVGTSL